MLLPTTSKLRDSVKNMSKEDMINLRDVMEENWNNELRPLMQILSLGCINKFGQKLSELK